MPHHAHTPVAELAAMLVARFVANLWFGHFTNRPTQLHCTQRLANRHSHRVELMITGHLLGDATAVVLEHDEVTQQV